MSLPLFLQVRVSHLSHPGITSLIYISINIKLKVIPRFLRVDLTDRIVSEQYRSSDGLLDEVFSVSRISSRIQYPDLKQKRYHNFIGQSCKYHEFIHQQLDSIYIGYENKFRRCRIHVYVNSVGSKPWCRQHVIPEQSKLFCIFSQQLDGWNNPYERKFQ